MSALELAKRLKQEHLEEQEEARHAKQLKSESDARIRKKLEDILDKTLGEFDGVNEIEFKIQPRGRVLTQHDRDILVAYVGWHTYENPNVDYKDEITDLAINWSMPNKQQGHDSTEERFSKSMANVLASHI